VKHVIPAGVTEADARLAWELVANISPLGDIMRRHGLTFDEYDEKKRDPLFTGMLEQYRKQWNSELSVNQRVALKAALLTEDSLLDVYAIIKDTEASPGQKLEAFGALAKAGEVGQARKDQGTPGTPVHITINVPGRRGLTFEATPAEVVASD
jgi:uncharacterized NAD(P)/FAD-binding protein YdhS